MDGIEVFAWILTALLGVVFIFSLIKIAKNPRKQSSNQKSKDSDSLDQ